MTIEGVIWNVTLHSYVLQIAPFAVAEKGEEAAACLKTIVGLPMIGK